MATSRACRSAGDGCSGRMAGGDGEGDGKPRGTAADRTATDTGAGPATPDPGKISIIDVARSGVSAAG